MRKYIELCDKVLKDLPYGRSCAHCLTEWKITPATTYVRAVEGCTHTDYVLRNILPVCDECKEKYSNSRVTDYFTQSNIDYILSWSLRPLRSILLINGGISEDAYYKTLYQELKKNIL